MLVFIDESGDLGFKLDRGSSRFFTIALVVFDDSVAAQACQQVIEGLKQQLHLPTDYEFHFHDDSHDRRLALLSTVARQHFWCYTFTLDKASPRLTGPGFRHRSPDYKWVCRTAIDNVASELQDATIIIDGSGERTFRQQISAYLRRELNPQQRAQIKAIRLSRSHSDPLIQLADYVAGVTNRLYEEKAGAELYELYLRRKRRSQRKWP